MVPKFSVLLTSSEKKDHLNKNFIVRNSDIVMVYKYINIIGTSPNGIDDAVRDAVSEATKTIHNIEWAELGRVTFKVIDNDIKEFQAEVKMGFKIERKD